MESKRCTRCDQIKLITDFHRNSRTADGLENRCKSCRHEEYRSRSKFGKRFEVTPEICHDLARTRNLDWLGPVIKTVRDKTRWRCLTCGHEWEAMFYSLRQSKQGCMKCFKMKMSVIYRLKPDAYHEIAKLHGLEWLGSEVENNGISTNWQCNKGHVFCTPYEKIQSGRGCPICNREANADRMRLKPDAYHEIAEQRGFEWLGPEVLRNRDKTTWQCQYGHQWQAPYDSIQSGQGCPFCARLTSQDYKRLKPADYIRLAEENELIWLGPPVRSNADLTWWRCGNGHVIETSYARLKAGIKRGYNCPRCSKYINGRKVSQQQIALCEMLDGDCNCLVEGFCADIVLHEKRIVVEYDGNYWHYEKQDHDLDRDYQLIDMGWNVIRVRSGTMLPTIEQLALAIERIQNGERRIEIVLSDWRKK